MFVRILSQVLIGSRCNTDEKGLGLDSQMSNVWTGVTGTLVYLYLLPLRLCFTCYRTGSNALAV